MEFLELIRTSRAQAQLLRGQEAAPLCGTLCVTGHHLLLSPGSQVTLGLWLLRSVDSIEKRVAGDAGTITLRCKDLRVLQLDIEGVDATLDAACSLETSAWRLSGMNKDFSSCRYPRAVIVPRAADSEAVALSTRFCPGGR